MNLQASAVGGQPLLEMLTGVDGSLAGVDKAPVYGLSDADLEAAFEACQSAQARLFGMLLGLVREADERDLGRRQGGASTAAWLAGRFRLRPGQARTLVRLANWSRRDDGPVDYAANVRSAATGRELRATAAALADGAISAEHVVVVSKVMERIPRAVSVDEARQAEAELAGFCGQHDPGVVAKLGDYLLALMAADTLEDAEAERHRRRELRLNEATGGISGSLTPEGMALLRTALDPLAAPNPSSDGERDPRSPGQRLVDALVELARRAIAGDGFEHNHGISHRVLVTIGLNTLTADHPHPENPTASGSATGGGDTSSTGSSSISTQPSDSANGHGSSTTGGTATDASSGSGGASSGSGGASSEPGDITGGRTLGGDGATLLAFTRAPRVPPGQIQWGGLISPATARRIACCAGIQRVVLDPNGAVLDVGREYRTATPAQFAALTARDGGCAFPGCTRPSAWCIAHHIIHWADGGPTDLDNLALLCGHHHTVVHHHGWDVRLGPDRLPDFYPAPWVDPDREPRRNTRPRYGMATVTPDR